MIVTDLLELQLHPVADRGAPNLERIPMFVNTTTNMGQYGIMVGYSTGAKAALPYHDNLFWFGDGVVNAGDWIILYTGGGTPRVEDWPATGGKIYTVHWGKTSTIFANTNVVPILFRVDAVAVAGGPQNVPQFALGRNGS